MDVSSILLHKSNQDIYTSLLYFRSATLELSQSDVALEDLALIIQSCFYYVSTTSAALFRFAKYTQLCWIQSGSKFDVQKTICGIPAGLESFKSEITENVADKQISNFNRNISI